MSKPALLYERHHSIIINDVSNVVYYYFDYDQRSHDINMEFQHFHSFFEIMIPLSPKAYHLISGTPYTLQANDMVLLAPSALHRTEYLSGDPSQRIIINFLYPDNFFGNKAAFDHILQPFFTDIPIFRFKPEHSSQLFGLLNDIFILSKQSLPPEVHQLMIHQKFIGFLYQLWSIRNQNIYVPEKLNNELEEKMYSIANYIHNHYQEDLSLDSLARIFYISSFYLSHQFKAIVGYTLTQYIQMTRIRNAQYMLLNTNHKITTIAEECGFTSFSQFNRVFRKMCDMSPSDYRKFSFQASPLPFGNKNK